jgi:hypothetical protein
MTPFQRYLAEEVAIDHVDDLIPRAAAQAWDRVQDRLGRHLA